MKVHKFVEKYRVRRNFSLPYTARGTERPSRSRLRKPEALPPHNGDGPHAQCVRAVLSCGYASEAYPWSCSSRSRTPWARSSWTRTASWPVPPWWCEGRRCSRDRARKRYRRRKARLRLEIIESDHRGRNRAFRTTAPDCRQPHGRRETAYPFWPGNRPHRLRQRNPFLACSSITFVHAHGLDHAVHAGNRQAWAASIAPPCLPEGPCCRASGSAFIVTSRPTDPLPHVRSCRE